MKNKKQLVICDLLLKLFDDNFGEINDIIYKSFILNNANFANEEEINKAMRFLIKYEIAERKFNEPSLKILTPKGETAVIIGIKEYIVKYNKEQKLKIKLLESSVNNIWFMRIISIISLFIAAITIFLKCK